MQALICNKDHPEYGCATIPLPIPDEEYAHCMELLKPLGIGDIMASDCYIDQLTDAPPALDVLERQMVNIDELDFLARSLARYTDEELAKFQSVAAARDCQDMITLINLSFCCEGTTVITDFSDLESVGKSHYLTISGGAVPTDIYEKVNGEGVARNLINSGDGKVTPYGVLYENGMQVQALYTGGAFPIYYERPGIFDLSLTPEFHPENEEYTLLQLPMPQERLERMMTRGGFEPGESFLLQVESGNCPAEVESIMKKMDFQDATSELVREINKMCLVIEPLTAAEREKLNAAVKYAGAEYPMQVRHLAESLDQFDFFPGVKTAEDYGKYMIQQSGHFEYDENLEGYYDYARYGAQRLAHESGQFTEAGYISYHGTMSLDELMIQDTAMDRQPQEPVEEPASGIQPMQSPFL